MDLNLSGFEDPLLNGTFKIVDIPTSKSVSVEIGTSRNLRSILQRER